MVDQALNAAAFPRLDKAQLAALEGCPLSKLKHYRDGEKLCVRPVDHVFQPDRGRGMMFGAPS